MSSSLTTRYSDLNRIELYSLFSTEEWSRLSFEKRIDACQELENRYATENGVQPCKVDTEFLLGAEYGYQWQDTIVLNDNLIRNGEFITEDIDENGNKYYTPVKVDAENWNTMETVFHEGTHGVREMKGQSSKTYIRADTDYSLYRIQAEEKAAYDKGQLMTLEAIDIVQENSGKTDANANDYYKIVESDAFEPQLQKAIQNYNDENIENTLNQFIADNDSGVVPQNPSESYTAISRAYNAQLENSFLMTEEFGYKEGVDFINDGSSLEDTAAEANGFDGIEDGASLTSEENDYSMSGDGQSFAFDQLSEVQTSGEGMSAGGMGM